ncbi:28S ribosomal protein S24, mitochondrial [Myotis davidii]|uniref:28S ribosomal protein S24, mitochondrial n=1 Tax=Myotis davidii TaxID=225400 RepID=L5LG34_MYODS|nr:28S ribosomal protein S24, mitochondrial [Myotis davidii]
MRPRPREGVLSRDCQAGDELVSSSVPTSSRCRSRKASPARSEQKQSRDWTRNVEVYLTGYRRCKDRIEPPQKLCAERRQTVLKPCSRSAVMDGDAEWLRVHERSNLDGEDHAAERTVEDVFLRKFMLGTFPGCLADQLVLKRRANQVEICALVLRQLPAHKFYFLVGYSETLLSYFYKCPVRVHLQTVPSKVVYKYI